MSERSATWRWTDLLGKVLIALITAGTITRLLVHGVLHLAIGWRILIALPLAYAFFKALRGDFDPPR